jgi:hypothetical protein
LAIEDLIAGVLDWGLTAGLRSAGAFIVKMQSINQSLNQPIQPAVLQSPILSQH